MKHSANIKSLSDTKQEIELLPKKFSSSRTKTKYKSPKQHQQQQQQQQQHHQQQQQQEKKTILTTPNEKSSKLERLPKNTENFIGDCARNDRTLKKLKKPTNVIQKNPISGSIRKIIINKTTTKSIRQIRSKKILKKLDSTIQPSAFVHVLSAFINGNLENMEYDYFTSTRKISMTLHDVPEESDDIYENSFLTYNVLKNNNKCTNSPILDTISKTVQTHPAKSHKTVNTSFVEIVENAQNTQELGDDSRKLVIKFEDEFEDKDKELLQMLFDNRYSKNESEIVLELLELNKLVSRSDNENCGCDDLTQSSEEKIEKPATQPVVYDKNKVVTLFFRNLPKKDVDSSDTIKTTTKEFDDFERDVFDFLTKPQGDAKINGGTEISGYDEGDFLIAPPLKLEAPHFSRILSKFGITVRERINRYLAEQNFKFCKIALSEHNVEKEVLFLYTR